MTLTATDLGLELLRASEAAALAAAEWIGKGDRHAGDHAGVEAMRTVLALAALDGTVVIGEGEKDQAPMLHCGERVGVGDGAPAVDVAVDPVEGTNLLAKGLPNAISAIAIAPRGSLWRSRASYYMDKLVVGPEAAGRVHLDAPVRDNLAAVAEARGVAIGDLLVVILDRPRNEDKITAVRAAGSRVRLISDGDVAPALMTAMPEAPVDVVMGIGGTPEGVLTACALTGLGGEIQGRLAPQSDAERTAIELEGTPLDAVLTMADLVRDPDTYFSATGITTGDLLHGVKRNGAGRVTNSVVCSGRSGRWQVIRSRHPD